MAELLCRVELAVRVVVLLAAACRAWWQVLIRVDAVAGFYRLLIGLLEFIAYTLVENFECIAL